MFILNNYKVTSTVPNSAAGAVNNINPSVITGVTGNSAAADSATKITASATFVEQVISKLVMITIPNAGLLAANNNYIYVPLTQLGITGVRAVRAATLLGVYNANSVENPIGGVAGGTPSFIGIWDKTVANVTTLMVQADTLSLRIPTAQIPLFADKAAVVQLFYT